MNYGDLIDSGAGHTVRFEAKVARWVSVIFGLAHGTNICSSPPRQGSSSKATVPSAIRRCTSVVVNRGPLLVKLGAGLAALGLLLALGVTSNCENTHDGVCGVGGFVGLTLLAALPGGLVAGIGGLIVKRRIDREERERIARSVAGGTDETS